MKRVILIIFLILAGKVFAQNLDEMLTKRQPDCSDIADNSSLYFQK